MPKNVPTPVMRVRMARSSGSSNNFSLILEDDRSGQYVAEVEMDEYEFAALMSNRDARAVVKHFISPENVQYIGKVSHVRSETIPEEIVRSLPFDPEKRRTAATTWALQYAEEHDLILSDVRLKVGSKYEAIFVWYTEAK